jgi:hypothetical protein
VVGAIIVGEVDPTAAGLVELVTGAELVIESATGVVLDDENAPIPVPCEMT